MQQCASYRLEAVTSVRTNARRANVKGWVQDELCLSEIWLQVAPAETNTYNYHRLSWRLMRGLERRTKLGLGGSPGRGRKRTTVVVG